ncbi:MAG TPA: polysaccharide pyruvyl transferase family protein [Rhizomicrobium sp.]|nr:polysaccharide pyruvyl transferase family protein [Rhizomicrobium sp.]
MTARKVLHIASHGLNVGDGALNGVIRERLCRLSPEPLAFTSLDAVLDPKALAASDADAFDLVLVGGGGAINNNLRATRLGLELPMTLAEYRRSRTPFAFVALGHNLFPGEKARHAGALGALMKAAGERGDPFSVRNDGSLARLHRDIGDAARTAVEIPDPGFFVAPEPVRPVEAGERPYMVLQVAADRLPARLGAGPLERALWPVWRPGFAALADALADFALDAWRAFGFDVLVAPHIPADVELGAAVVERLYRRAGAAAAERPFRLMGTPHPSQAARFFAAYGAAELVVGMRGHAAICAVGLGRPFVALASHPKITGFMESCGLGEWCVPADGDIAGDLASKTRALLDGGLATYGTQRDARTAGFGTRLDAFLGAALARMR